MAQPVIYISEEKLSDSLTKVGSSETFNDSVGELIDGGFVVAIGPESAPTKVFSNSEDFHEWFSELQDVVDGHSDEDPVDDDPELEAIEHINMLEESGWPTIDESLSPKGMDQAEVRAGLRDPE